MSMYTKIQDKIKIGKHTLKNRMVYAPTASGTADSAGNITQKTIEYYDNLSKGGASLIYVGAVNMGPRVLNQFLNMLCLHEDKYINGLADLAEVIHKNGALAGVQVMHLGRQGMDDVVCFSDVKSPLTNIPVRVLSETEIEEYENYMAKAALRGKVAGFDMVDLHFSHGYFGGSSLSPHTNRRTDKYGGSLEKRMTFALNVIRKTRKLVGDDYPLTCRIVTSEMFDGGITIDDSVRICKKFEEEGIAAINLSAGVHEVYYYFISPYPIPRGYNAKNAKEFKNALNIPVGIAGRINDPKLAEQILENNYADYILLSRGLIADPEFPKKVIEERSEQIRRCVACNQCLREMFSGRSLKCQINPLAGRERSFANIGASAKKKKVAVIGAGPAGLEAARAAAIRGHDVTLYEKEGELLSPQYRNLLKAKVNREFSTTLSFYKEQFNVLKNVRILLNTEVNKDILAKDLPDVAVIATGARSVIPAHVKDADSCVDVYDCGKFFENCDNEAIEGEKVFCVIGEDVIALDIVDYLSRKGFDVNVVAGTNGFPNDVEPILAYYFLTQFAKRNNVKIHTNSTLKIIGKTEIIIFNKMEENETKLHTDCVVFASNRESSNQLENEISRIVKETYIIGDAKEPRLIIDAIREGFVTGMTI